MIEAFITALFAIFLAYLSGREKHHSYFLLLSFVLLTAFLSLGYYWGNDVPTYEVWYNNLSESDVSWWDFPQYADSFYQREYGYICLNLLCKPLGFWGMRAVLFIIENVIIYSFIVRHVDRRWYWLAVFIYVFNPNYWVLSSSMMRQWLAICIVLVSADYLMRNKKLIFTLLVIIAATFHVSSIICLIFLPLSLFQRKVKKNAIIIFFIFLLLYYILSPFFINYIALYLKAEALYMGYTSTHGSFGITNIIFMLIYTRVLFYAVKLKQKDSLFNWIMMLYGLVLPLLSFGELSSRLGFYFSIFGIVSFPLFMSNHKISKQHRIGVISAVCMLYLYQFFTFFQSPTWIKSFGTYQTIIGKL